MKKVLMIFLAIALIFTMSAPVFAADLTLQQKFDELKAAGILDGDAEGNMLALDSKMERQQLAKIACTLSGVAATPGVDVAAFADDYKYQVWGFDQGWIQAAYNSGLMIGKGAAGFDAKGEVTVAELLTVIIRTMGMGDQLDNDNWSASAMEVAIANNLIPATGVNATDPATYAALVTQSYNSYAYNLAPAEPVVQSVTALNGSQLKVDFSQKVDKATAETVANYTILRNNVTEAGFTPVLQDDGKTVIITLGTPVLKNTSANFSITIQNILLAGSYYDTVKYFATSLLVTDNVAPVIASAKALTNTNVATSAVVKFSEPVAAPTLKVNGVTKPASLSADGTTATIPNLSLAANATHTIEAINLTDLSNNVTLSATLSFTVTVDQEPGTFAAFGSSDNAIMLLFDKDMDSASVTAGIKLKGEDLNDMTKGPTGYMVIAAAPNVYRIQIMSAANPFVGSTTSYTYTVVAANTIKDTLGNLSPATTATVTLSVDKVKPTVQSISYVKDNTGKVAKLLVTYSESPTAVATKGIDIVKVTDGTSVATVTATGVASTERGNNTVTYTLVTPTALVGDFEVQLDAGLVTDGSHAKNALDFTKQVVNFGAAAAGTVNVTSAVIASGTNNATIDFDTAVTYVTATNPANYTINGVALPASTVITYASATQVTFTLPANFIATSDTGAVLRVANVKTAGGATVAANQTVVSVIDNTAPVLASGVINANGTISLGFSEAVTSGAGTHAQFVVKVDGKTLDNSGTVYVLADGIGADAGKYVLTVNKEVDYIAAVGNSWTNPINGQTYTTAGGAIDEFKVEYIDVDNSGTPTAGDILISVTDTGTTGGTNATVAYNANLASTISVATVAAPSITDMSTLPNNLKGGTVITVK